MWGYHDVTDPSDAAMEQPVCWITNAFDRSPAELLRVESGNPAWGPLRGSLLNLSYGYGKVFVVPHEIVGGRMQGGDVRPADPAVPDRRDARADSIPANGQLYACGMFAWAGDQTQPGGFYRIRATGKPMFLPVGLHARKDGMAITFTDPLDREAAADPSHYTARTWSLKRTVNYGSDHHDERPLRDHGRAALSDDGRTVFLEIPDLQPTWCMEITYAIRGAGGRAGRGGDPQHDPRAARRGRRRPRPDLRREGLLPHERHTLAAVPLVANKTILTPTGGYLASGFTHSINCGSRSPSRPTWTRSPASPPRQPAVAQAGGLAGLPRPKISAQAAVSPSCRWPIPRGSPTGSMRRATV